MRKTFKHSLNSPFLYKWPILSREDNETILQEFLSILNGDQEVQLKKQHYQELQTEKQEVIIDMKKERKERKKELKRKQRDNLLLKQEEKEEEEAVGVEGRGGDDPKKGKRDHQASSSQSSHSRLIIGIRQITQHLQALIDEKRVEGDEVVEKTSSEEVKDDTKGRETDTKSKRQKLGGGSGGKGAAGFVYSRNAGGEEEEPLALLDCIIICRGDAEGIPMLFSHIPTMAQLAQGPDTTVVSSTINGNPKEGGMQPIMIAPLLSSSQEEISKALGLRKCLAVAIKRLPPSKRNPSDPQLQVLDNYNMLTSMIGSLLPSPPPSVPFLPSLSSYKSFTSSAILTKSKEEDASSKSKPISNKLKA